MAAALTAGSMCSGYGGLDRAVVEHFGAELAWVADNGPGPARILAHHYPHIPNLGDLTAVDWATVQRVDVVCAGFPCQDVSVAGWKRGLVTGSRSGVWSGIAAALAVLQPQVVFLENVRGLLSARADSYLESCPWCVGFGSKKITLRALGAVLGDLSDLGFDAEWQVVSAADAGAPHRRERVFILAWRRGAAHPGGNRLARVSGHAIETAAGA